MYLQKKTKTKFRSCTSITDDLNSFVSESGIQNGLCLVTASETTAALGITSFWDPRGLEDLMDEIDRNFPARVFCHKQITPYDSVGNSKSTLIGRQKALLIQNGKLLLGSSQGVVLIEFDGPRERQWSAAAVERRTAFYSFALKTTFMGAHDITEEVREAVKKSGIQNGLCQIMQMHSTAGLALGSSDKAAQSDLMQDVERLVPTRADFKHRETASDAAGHVKTVFTDSQLSLPVTEGKLELGEDQAIVFLEFDGPRPRKYTVGVAEQAN